jgi:hypothetical protein
VTAAAFAQGLYYVISGAWALLHIESFQKVTGPKTDLWLVKTVGLMLMGIGGGLIFAGVRQQFDPALVFIAIASAAALLAVEVVYVYKGVISPVYALDAAAEAVFIIWWLACLTY